MKIMIASDIHGSADCCRRLLAAFEREEPDKLLLLGDLLYHGARNSLPGGYGTAETASLLNSIKSSVLCVRGNCDSDVDSEVQHLARTADSAAKAHVAGRAEG